MTSPPFVRLDDWSPGGAGRSLQFGDLVAEIRADRPADVTDGPGSVPYRAIEFSVPASGLYYVGADFAALAGPDNLWPRFVHSDGFDPANPAGGSCRTMSLRCSSISPETPR